VQAGAGEMSDSLDENYFREIAMDLAVLVGGVADAEPGTSWEHRFTGSHQMGSITYRADYRFEGLQHLAGIPVALVNRTAEMSFEPDLSELPSDAPDIRFRTRDTSHSAQIMFDLSRHEIVGANIDQVLDLEMTMTLGDREVVRTMRESTNTQVLRVEEE